MPKKNPSKAAGPKPDGKGKKSTKTPASERANAGSAPTAKKKAGSEKSATDLEKNLPSSTELGNAISTARYGKDARNPAMWDLINAHTHLDICSKVDTDKPLMEAMIDGAELQGRDSVHWSIRLGFYEAASKAILVGDADYFREVARLLEERIGCPSQSPVDLAVNRAFNELRNKGKGKLPTKKQVKSHALSSLCLPKVLARIGTDYLDAHSLPNGAGKAGLKPAIAKEVRKEMDRYPEQNWTAIFRRCGLSDLPSDKGGQPSHRKRPYYP